MTTQIVKPQLQEYKWDRTNPLETDSIQRQIHTNDKVVQQLTDSWLYKKWTAIQRDTPQDPVLAIPEIISPVVEARHAMFNGIDMVDRVNTTKDSVHVPVPTFGDLAAETHRAGGNAAQRGEEMKWVTITPKKEVSADAMWDLNAIEDYDFNVAQRQMQSATLRYQGKISKDIYGYFGSYLSTASNVTTTIGTDDKAYKLAVGANGKFGYDNITRLIQNMKARNRMPTHLCFNPADTLDIIHDSKFIDSQEAGQFLNKSTGAFGGLLQIQLIESSQVPVGKAYITERSRGVCIVFRRDMHMVTYDAPPNSWKCDISGKYAMAVLDPGSIGLMSKE